MRQLHFRNLAVMAVICTHSAVALSATVGQESLPLAPERVAIGPSINNMNGRGNTQQPDVVAMPASLSSAPIIRPADITIEAPAFAPAPVMTPALTPAPKPTADGLPTQLRPVPLTPRPAVPAAIRPAAPIPVAAPSPTRTQMAPQPGRFAPPPLQTTEIADQPGTWTVPSGTTLRAVLSTWARRAGWSVRYRTDRDYLIEVGGPITGNFEQAAATLITAFATSKPPPLADFHPVNSALVISSEAGDD